MKHFALAAGMATALLTTPIHAADLAKCSAISDDSKRLACYDALAKAASPAPASSKEREEALVRNEIIDRC